MSDMVNLFGTLMNVQDRFASRRNQCFGQTLLPDCVLAGVQQFADFRAVLGRVRNDFVTPGFMRHWAGRA